MLWWSGPGQGGWYGAAIPLRRFNRLPGQEAVELLARCLPVERWLQSVADARPFGQLDDLLEVARDSAFPFTPAELEAAVAALEPPSVVPPPRRGESAAEVRLRHQLSTAAQHYRYRFGRDFFITVEGKSDTQILVQLWNRLGHDPDTEDQVLAQQIRERALATLVRLVHE